MSKENKSESQVAGSASTTKKRVRILKRETVKEETTDPDSLEDVTYKGTPGSGKWSKYSKKYKPSWETLEIFQNWLQRTPDALISRGKPEAFCRYCQQCLRAHKSDLVAHARSKKHMEAASCVMAPLGDCRSFLESYVPDEEDQAKSEPLPEEASQSRKSKPAQSVGADLIRTRNAARIIEQINQEMEETLEKVKICEEELNNLLIKKARLEHELEYYCDS